MANGFLVVRQQIVQLDGDTYDCDHCGEGHKGLSITPPKTTSGEATR